MTFGSELLNRQAEIDEYGQLGNEAISKLADYIRKRAALSEEYARGLQKLNRQFCPVQSYEVGYSLSYSQSVMACRLDDLLGATDKIVGAHMLLVEQVQNSLIDSMKATAREHDRIRREVLTDIRNQKSGWRKTMSAFEKIKRAKDMAVKAAEEARIAFERANSDKNVTKAYVEKLRDDYATKARKTLVSKEEYIQAARLIKAQQVKLYEENLPCAFDKLQKIEETRLLRIRSHITEFGTLLNCAASEEASNYKFMMDKWLKFVPDIILQQFINEIRGDGPVDYPESILIDECAATECLGLVFSKSEPSLSRQASKLLLTGDFEGIRKRLVELEMELSSLEKQHEGIKNLCQLYQRQPELADERTKVEAEEKFIEIAAQLSSLALEKEQLEKRIMGSNLDGNIHLTKSSIAMSSPVLWEDPQSLATVSSPSLTAIGTNDISNPKFKQHKARVIFDFEALDSEHELSIKVGDEVTILAKDGEWWQAEMEGRIGYIPFNYVQELLSRPFRTNLASLFSTASMEHDAVLLGQTINLLGDNLSLPVEVPSKPATPSKKSMDIKLTGMDCIMLDAFAHFCISIGHTLGALMPGPASLPLRIQKWSVLSSPHVHKTAWTQLERRTYGKALKVYGMNMDLMKKYIWYLKHHCPPDIQLECMMHEYVSISEIQPGRNKDQNL